MPTHLSIPNVSVTDPVDVVVDPHKYDTVAGASGRETPQERHDGEDLEQLEANPKLASTLDVQSPDARSQSKRHNQGLVLDITSIRIPTGSIGALYPESRFLGHQRSGKSQYEVEVTIKHVDLRTNSLSGFLYIHNLSEQDITTFFTGEIITSSHQFFNNPYGAEPTVDWQHWTKFPHLRQLMQHWIEEYPKVQDIPYDFTSSDFIYARWKERHLVPDHKAMIVGACFKGFYYVSYQKSTGIINGWYYHQNSELNQKLTLKHCARKQGIIPVYEFR